MKLFLWVFFGLAVAAVAFWMVITPGVPRSPVYMLPLVLIFGVSPIGTFWMFYMALRYEKNPWLMILLAFIPYAFLWYYFERVRPERQVGHNRPHN
jgi:hypothetical protein